MWALLQFKDGVYRRNNFLIQVVFIVFAFLVGAVDFIYYSFICTDCEEITYYANIFSIYYVLIVGAPSVAAVLVKLLLSRMEVVKVLKKSNISMSFYYRFLFALILFIVIGGIAVSSTLLPVNADTLFSVAYRFRIDYLTGLFATLVFGSSQECLKVWRDWIKKYLNIDLTPQKETSTASNPIASKV